MPSMEKCDKALPQRPPPDENVTKDDESPKSIQDTDEKKDAGTEDHTRSCCCRWSKEANIVAAKQGGALVTWVPNPISQTRRWQRRRWSALWGENPLYSQPPWKRGRRPRVLFGMWMFHEPCTRPISNDQLIAEIKGIYANYTMFESKCIEVDTLQASRYRKHDIDVIPFLEATPCSILIKLQRGGINPEEIIRNALQSSRERIKDIAGRWNRLPPDGGNGFTGIHLDPLVPTIEQSLRGFLIALEVCAKDSGSPDCQALADPTTKTTGDEGSSKVVAEWNMFTVGCDILKAIDESTEQAKCEIAERTEKEAQEAQIRARKAEQETKQKNDKVTPSELPTDCRPLEDTSRYKKIGNVYYLFADGRWMNISLRDDQYRDSTALHTTGMKEMYDFILASGHPASSARLRCLGAKYNVPARLWRHCIHDYLEVLRLRLPESLEHVIPFIIQSYSMMQLLEETTNSKHFTIECTGDLARYRFAIEDEDEGVKLHWKNIAIWQYTRSTDLNPTNGRPYHHIGILSRGSYRANIFNMLKALTTCQPYLPAWDTMLSAIEQFVAPEGQISTELREVLPLDEDNLYTAIARLMLASAPSANLKDNHFDTSKESHLLAFDKLLGLVAGLDDPKTSHAITEWALSLVSPVSHCLPSTCYISGKASMGNAAPSPLSGLLGWIVNKLCRPFRRPEASVQSFSVRPSPELGLILCQLLLLEKDAAVADRAAQLLSVVNLRILARPVTHDVKLWEYLHVLLVFMRYLDTRPDMKKRFGYAFHPELMAPLLNLLLHRLKDRGGDAWEALFRPEFPTLWVPLNTKDKPEKYGIRTVVAQREYCARHYWKQEAESATDDTATNATDTEQEQTTENTMIDSFYSETAKTRSVMSGGVEDDTGSVQTDVQTKAEDVEHDKPKDGRITSQSFTASDVVSESDGGFNGPVQEGLFTLVLPEDRLMRGFPFAKETPSPPEPDQSPSEKQIARAQWEKNEAVINQRKKDKAAWKRQKDEHRQQRRIRRGVDPQPRMQMCAACQILIKSRKTKESKNVSAPETCQERCRYHRINTQEPKAPTNAADGSPTPTPDAVIEYPKRNPEIDVKYATKNPKGPFTITLDAIPEAVEEHCEETVNAARADVTECDAAPADSRKVDDPAECLEVSKAIPDSTQSTQWVTVDAAGSVVSDDRPAVWGAKESAVQEAANVLPHEPEDPIVGANESYLNEPPHLGLLFAEADEEDETTNENSSTLENTTKPDDNTDISTAGKGVAKEDSTSPAVTEPESDYGISGMFARADSEAKDRARIEEALRLDPYFYPPGFFERSRLDIEELLVCRDSIQAIDVAYSRELRIVWTAVSIESFFSFHGDKKEDYAIGIPGQRSIPQPYPDAQMPTIITRNDGSRVIYVDPAIVERVVRKDRLWEKRAEKNDRRLREHREQKREREREEQEEGEKKQQVTETKELKEGQESKDTQNESMGETEGIQVEKSTNLHSFTQICSYTALVPSPESCEHAQKNKGAKDVVSDQAMEKNVDEFEPAQKKFETAEDELDMTKDAKPGQGVEDVNKTYNVLGEPVMEAAKEGAVTTTTTTTGVTDEPTVQVPSLRTSAGGVAQLTQTALAAVQDEGNVDETDAQFNWSVDGAGKKEGDDDNEDSQGWVDIGGKHNNLLPHIDMAVG